MKYVIYFFLFSVSFPFLSRIWGKLVKIRKPASVIRKIVSLYADYYNIDMSEYAGNTADYDSLSRFFTRPLDENIRPLEKDAGSFLSPSDGKITVLESIVADIATQVKGRTYKMTELLRKEINLSEGYCMMTIYLSPRDYHRYHVPVESEVVSYIHTGWRLFPVNKLSADSVNNLFVRNERVCVKFKSGWGDFYFVAVGAAFVGSIKMDFYTEPVEGKWVTVNRKYPQNKELGMFEMGSTIILVIPEKMIEELKVKEGDVIKAGQPLLKLKQVKRTK